MSGGEIKKKTIVEIFNDMEYEEKLDDCEDHGNPSKSVDINELSRFSITAKEPKSFDSALTDAVNAQTTWGSFSSLQRADSMHKIWKALKEISNLLSQLKNEFSTLVDYFDFFTDVTIETEAYSSWRRGIVLVVLTDYSPYFVLGATVPAALAAGCSVIVLATQSTKFVPLLLQDTVLGSGLQEGVFSVVTELNGTDVSISNKISKVFFCGSYFSAQKFYTKSVTQSFNFFCPNNTSALILESCDLNAAVDKIVTATWGKDSLFGVTNVVIQESIFNSFLEKLKYRMKQVVVENINSTKFKDKLIYERINEVVSEALKAGATVEKCTKHESAIEWGPTVIVNYQNQNAVEDVPILKVLLCRTAKEGVALLNNCRYGLGTSIWSEISSQALEISSKLDCLNVWINCHGVFEPGVPLQVSALSGDCVFGGSDGLLQYMSFTTGKTVDKYKSADDGESTSTNKTNAFQMAASAYQAFNSWRQINRRNHLKDIAKAMEHKEFPQNSNIINKAAHFGNIINFTKRNSRQEFVIVQSKIPIGVIVLIVYTSTIDFEYFISLITPPIALGNTVIVVLKNNNPAVKLVVKKFNDFLPKNVLNVVVGLNIGIQLASDPNVQAVWIERESTISEKHLETIKSNSAKSLKHIWIIPSDIGLHQKLIEKECLKNKVVWLTKVDQFP